MKTALNEPPYWLLTPFSQTSREILDERLIALVKTSFKKSYGGRLLDYVDLSTAMCLIMDTINSRPLTYVSSDEVISVLTPNHFLRFRSCKSGKTMEISTPRTDASAKKVIRLWEQV